jgi:serine/threonine-protein kinase HipA
MTGVEKLIVSISLGRQEIELGELVSLRKKIYFKYYPEFIDRGMQISPFKMPLSDKLLSADTEPFDGLFGVFSDSLPDGWGQLLLSRVLSSRGILLNQIIPMDRLAYVGLGGMGALFYRPEIGQKYDSRKILELDSIAHQVNHVLEGTSSDVIEELLALGGTSGGARPKIFAGYNPATDNLIHGSADLPDGSEHWIIKFPSSSDPIDIANIEYAYYKMALDAGIEMNQCRLFTGDSGMKYFGTKRFDRVDGQRLHMHSASGLMHDNFRLSNMDYGHLMDCAFKLENHVTAYEKVLRQAAFNIYAHNRDDHSKNFSFLMDQNGAWRLAPAYDLTFSSSSHGLHSTVIAGESKTPGRKHLLELAKHFSMKNPNEIIDRVQDIISNWSKYAINSGVETRSMNLIKKTILQIKD